MEKTMTALQSSVEKVLETAKFLIGHIKPQSALLIQSQTRLLSCDQVQLAKTLAEIGAQAQVREKVLCDAIFD